jgi:hypothetical protein
MYLPPAAVIDSSHKQQDVEVRLAKGAVISGRIRDADGKPLVKARVSAMEKSYLWGRATLTPRAIESTNDFGEYRMFSLHPGEYYIAVEIEPPYISPAGRQSAMSLRAYYPGVGTVSVASPVHVNIGEERDAVDFTFTKVLSYTVSGIVIRPPDLPTTNEFERFGRSSERSSFVFLPRLEGSDPIDAGYLGMRNLAPEPVAPAREVPFELRGVPPGAYELFCCREAGYSGRVSVLVTSDVHDLRILMKPDKDLRGRIRVDREVDAGFALDQVGVELRPLSAMPQREVRTRVDRATREFTINGVPEGRFAVSVYGIPYDAYVSAIQAGPTDLFRTDGFDVGDSFDGLIDITITPKGGSIRGVVQRGILDKDVGVAISLVPELSRRGNRNLYKRIDTNPSGEFHIRGIAPGNYKLFAWPASPPDTAEQNAAFLKTYESLGYSITVTNADIDGVVVPMIRR